MIIYKATYGNKDVTSILNRLVKNNSLKIKVSNDLFGDTNPGVVKYLEIESDIGHRKIIENSYLNLPETTNTKLGIFYTNNNVKNVVKESLKSLEKFSDVDILTCVWESIPNNSFYEIQALTKTSVHLNIIIQILQLLYLADQIGKYKYISFLEHDVLYPDGYFNYPDFDDGVMTNMNYIGICENGFQKKTANHEPLHQMTMRFNQSVDHFENLFKEAIKFGGVLLEPQKNRHKWECVNPSIHVNHGKHFTSHFSIYSKETYTIDPYWGNSSELVQRLFKT
jgi:hypothetical protein